LSIAERTSGIAARPRALPGVRALNLRTALLVGGICLIPIALYAPFYTEPFARDEGFYAAAAQGMLHHGQVPYRDFFDNKPPLVFCWYAFSFLLFGQHVWAPRVVVSVLVSLATLCVYLTGRQLYSPRGASVAALIFACSISFTKLEINGNTEFFMLLPMSAGFLAFTRATKTGSRWMYFLAGVAGGATVLTKTIYALPMVFLFCYAVWARRPERSWSGVLKVEAWGRPALMVAGSLLLLMVVSAPIVLSGALWDMLDALTYYSLIYSSDVTWGYRAYAVAILPLFLLVVVGPLLLLAAGGSVLALRGENRAQGIMLVGWLLAGLASIMVVGRYYHHYFAALLPAAALVSAPAVLWMLERRKTLLVKVLLGGVLPLVAMSPLSYTVKAYFQPNAAQRHAAKFGVGLEGNWELLSPALGQWLKENSQPGDRIYNLGFESQLYFYSGRTSPTRFYFDHAFALDKKYESEALRDLAADPPALVVDSAKYEGNKHAMNYYSEPIHDWIAANYDYVGFIEFADVWRLKQAAQ
jgi:4-amino-4-deoxy-L-arabinose transferase-like glycosyltransferase